MNKNSIFLAACLAIAIGGSANALTIPAPPFFAEAIEYMGAQGISEACLDVRVRVGKPSEIEVVRSSGDARFDAVAVKGLRLEIDVMERFPIQSRPFDAEGWRAVPLKLSNPGRRNTKVIGCAGKATAG